VKRDLIPLKSFDRNALGAALRYLYAQALGGVFRSVINARTLNKLSVEHANALVALRNHHEFMLRTFPDTYRTARTNGPVIDRDMTNLHDEAVYALYLLDFAQKQVDSEQGKCSAPDWHDIAYLASRK
jgi:hypothetical protein